MLDFAKLKKYLLFVLIGCLVISSIVAVVTVLVGEFNEITAKTFYTLLTAFAHALVGLLFIWDEERAKKYNPLSFLVNTLFFIVVISFITSVFGIWDIISHETVSKMFITYAIAIFAALHSDILSKATGKENLIDNIVYANYIFIALVFLMLQPIVHMHNPELVLGQFYYRVLAACAIIDGTLSVLTIIFHKLYMHKHPELRGTNPEKTVSGWTIFFIIIFSFWFIPFLFSLIISAFARRF
jgi:hypothetical protein